MFISFAKGMAGAELGDHMVEFCRRSSRDEVHNRRAGTAVSQAIFATACTKSRSFDRDFSEQGLNLPRLVIVDRPPGAASRARAAPHDYLSNLILGDPGLKLLENGLALGQFQAEVTMIGVVEIANDGHEVGGL